MSFISFLVTSQSLCVACSCVLCECCFDYIFPNEARFEKKNLFFVN